MLAWLCAVAAAVQVQLRASPTTLTVGQSGTIQVLVLTTGRNEPQAQTQRAPPVRTGSGVAASYVGQTQQLQNFNGRITRIQEFAYRLTAVQPGTWSVGPVELALDDGSRVTGDAVSVRVVPRSAEAESTEQYTAEATLVPDDVYEGQVVVFHTKFQSHLPGAQIRWRLPAFDGLRSPQHGTPTDSAYAIDDPSGPISVQESFVPLVAVATGTRDQGVATGEVAVPVGRADLFGFRRSVPEQIASKPMKLTVRELPPPPPGFSGLVGEFEVRSTLDRQQAAVGQSVPWSIVVTGDGVVEGFQLPAFAPPGASVYDNTSDVSARIDGERFRSTAAFNRVIVPTQAGELALPPLEIVTFSPSKRDYVTHRIELPTLTVVPGREGDGTVEAFGSAGSADEAPLAIDLRPTYTWGRATAPSLRAVLPPLLGLAAAPGFLMLTTLGIRSGLAARARRAEARARPPTARDALRTVPADPVERLVVFDVALRRLEAEVAGDADRLARVRELRARLGRARFGAGGDDPTLEADLRALIAEVG
ncbi:MAG: BatD family protein [Myxococcota bacterium]